MNEMQTSRRQFVKATASVAAVAALKPARAIAADKQSVAKRMLYVGTFSSPLQDTLPTQVDLPPGNGRGIHLFEQNPDTGNLIPVGIFEMGTSPSCLAINESATRLYSANETDRFGEQNHGTVSAFKINPCDGKLEILNTVSSGGAGPTYVSIHPTGSHLFVANYFGGSVSVFPILDDGRLGDASDVHNDEGEIGPTRATNAPPGSFAFSGHDRTHAHMIQPDPAGRYIVHVDLGLDKIFVWKFDPNQGTLIPSDHHITPLPPGDGPRHFYFHPNGKWFYSIQEEGSTLVLFDYEASSGKLSPRQTISTLPPQFAGSNFCSEVLVSDDGRFLYAGNRLHDSISVFAIDDVGKLSLVSNHWTRGNYPRSFSIDPDGRYLYCCNQRADNIATFEIDRQTGRLRFTDQYTPVGNPSMIAFADLPCPK